MSDLRLELGEEGLELRDLPLLFGDASDLRRKGRSGGGSRIGCDRYGLGRWLRLAERRAGA